MNADFVSKYTYRIDWSEEDQCFIGRCLEFPYLHGHADTREDALKEILLVVRESVKWMLEDKEELPVPLSLRAYSGKVSLRIPPKTHKRLSIEAAEERISLNQHITSLLESHQGIGSIARAISSLEERLKDLESVVQKLTELQQKPSYATVGAWWTTAHYQLPGDFLQTTKGIQGHFSKLTIFPSRETVPGRITNAFQNIVNIGGEESPQYIGIGSPLAFWKDE